jgi:SAM-dependent methyltransferase
LASALEVQARLETQSVPTDWFRERVMAVPSLERDAWLDAVLGLQSIPDDGPSLPRDGVPYLPCPVEALLKVVDRARIQPHDVVVDVGSGVGRSGAFISLLTGASVAGIEVQPQLVETSRGLAGRFRGLRFSVLEGDVWAHRAQLHRGSVFYLYCPFSGARLEQLMDVLGAIAQSKPMTVCAVDMPLPSRPWLEPMGEADDVTVFRSTAMAGPKAAH